MKDAIVVGAGLAGLAAAWRLRHWNTYVLEAEPRVGGRIRSERRGDYWLNWGGHVFAGPGSSTQRLTHEVGIDSIQIPGSLKALAMNGKFIKNGHIASYPFRVPMPISTKTDTVRAGMKILMGVTRYARVAKRRKGEAEARRQQRIYDFLNDSTFDEYVGETAADTTALFEATVSRSAGNMEQISAGAGIGYFNLVLGSGQGLSYGIVGGPSTLTESIAASLGGQLHLGAVVHEIVEGRESVVVRYTQDGSDYEVEGRSVVLATTANIAADVGVNLPSELREALRRIQYGPHVSTAFLTNEASPRPWDDIYAIAAPKRSFAIALNQANIVRGAETVRKPGGSFMTFSPASLGKALIDRPANEIVTTHLRDLDQILGHGFANSVVEAEADRWSVASPYNFPGRAKLQPILTRGTDRIFFAGDYLGTLYTETSIATGLAAAQEVASRLATERQTRSNHSPWQSN